MQAFDYVAPVTVKEAVSLLNKNGANAQILAGGTDLIAQLKEGRKTVKLVVDVKKIKQAQALSFTESKGLTIGAGVPCCEVYENEDVQKHFPALIDSASLIGSIQIQSRATVGGNLCNASPAADTIPTLIVLGAVATVVGPKGTRKVKAEDFCTGPGKNCLKKGEFVVSLQIPTPKPNSGSFFNRFIPRNEMDIAVVNAAVAVELSRNGKTIKAARIGLGAVAPTPLFLKKASQALVGETVTDDLVEVAAEAARKASKPISDMRGTIEQRVHLSGVLVRRALEGAIERARK